MGLKSIEMQVAIPRSQDAGKMQDQMMRQGQQFQETLTKQQLREDIIKRTLVNEYENVQMDEQEKENQQQTSEDQNKKQKREQQNEQDNNQSINHPYLGRKIDVSR